MTAYYDLIFNNPQNQQHVLSVALSLCPFLPSEDINPKKQVTGIFYLFT